MKAVCWHGKHDMRVEDVPDPVIVNPRDAILKVTATAICGSDLHLYNGFIPTMQQGDIIGHEFMGEVVEVGDQAGDLKVGDRVVVPFPIACGTCFFCRKDLYSLCDNSNPKAELADKAFGHAPAGIFGYSHLMGGYAGGQAQYVRVPYADVGPYKIESALSDEQVLFLTDILPTGWMAAENCEIEPGDTVAVWGCGPVGLFAMVSARLMGAERVIAIDRIPKRLKMARDKCGAEVIDYSNSSVLEALNDLTAGRGPDRCIDAVGLEAHGAGAVGLYDSIKQSVRLETDRGVALREVLMSCRKGGTVSIAGVYGGILDKVPMGAAFNKGLTLKMGQTHVHRYLDTLYDHIENKRIDPSFIITHRVPLVEAPAAYEMFSQKEDECVKVVLTP